MVGWDRNWSGDINWGGGMDNHNNSINEDIIKNLIMILTIMAINPVNRIPFITGLSKMLSIPVTRKNNTKTAVPIKVV